jgi:hypothetical protein
MVISETTVEVPPRAQMAISAIQWSGKKNGHAMDARAKAVLVTVASHIHGVGFPRLSSFADGDPGFGAPAGADIGSLCIKFYY